MPYRGFDGAEVEGNESTAKLGYVTFEARTHREWWTAVATFVFILMEMVEKVEELAKEVEELGELADFCTQLALVCPSNQ
jgi:hypothetical protein